MTIYHMKCGCELHIDEIIRTKNGYRCKKHPESGVKILEKQCVDCGDKIFVSPCAATTVRCKKCKVIHKRLLQKIADYKRRTKNKNKKYDKKTIEEKWQSAIDAWDCKHREDCLDESLIKKPLAKFLPCFGCEKYESYF